MGSECGFYLENFWFDSSSHPSSSLNDFHHPTATLTPPPPSSSSSSSSSSFAFSSMAVLNSELELQRQDSDFLLHFQNEKLRKSIEEQRKQQTKGVISIMEKEGRRAIREKEEKIGEGTRKGMELEERVKKAEMEKEGWKRKANEKEGMAMKLQRKLEKARERVLMVRNEAEDAESHNLVEQEAEEENGKSGFGCKRCKSRNRCEVLFLPCRHVCSCKRCEAFLRRCPVCHSVKEASLEVLFH